MKQHMMEEKDRLEQVLRGKLEGFRAEPPADMWVRIENSLAQEKRAAAFAASERGSRPLSRRRRILAWGISAAAALSLVSLAGYQYRLLQDGVGSTVAAVAGIAAAEETAAEVAAVTALPERDAAGRGKQEQTVRTGRRTLLAAAGVRTETADMPEVRFSDGNGRTAEQPVAAGDTGSEVKMIAAGADSQDNPVPGAEPERAAAVRSRVAVPVRAAENEAAEGKPGKEVSDTRAVKARSADERWARLLAEEHAKERRKGRRGGTSAGLYASNFGGGSNTQTMQGVARLNASSFMVNEVIQRVENSQQTLLYATTRVQKLKHRMPVTTGLSLNIGIAPRLSIETGLTYSYLRSEAEADGAWDYSVKQKLHYLGIPLAVCYDLVDGGRFGLYASAGGALEKCVSGTRTVKVSSDQDAPGAAETERLGVKGVQPSLGAAVGGEFRFAGRFGIYVEPGVGYYFENSKQPDSYRTEHPCNFTLKAGLRVNFR